VIRLENSHVAAVLKKLLVDSRRNGLRAGFVFTDGGSYLRIEENFKCGQVLGFKELNDIYLVFQWGIVTDEKPLCVIRADRFEEAESASSAMLRWLLEGRFAGVV
jgi:hypothetical protein